MDFVILNFLYAFIKTAAQSPDFKVLSPERYFIQGIISLVYHNWNLISWSAEHGVNYPLWNPLFGNAVALPFKDKLYFKWDDP